jgi:hypothetical protein
MLPGRHFLWWRAVLLSHFPESPIVKKKKRPNFLNSAPTHSEYVIITYFPRQQWQSERATIPRLCLHCLSYSYIYLILLWKCTYLANFFMWVWKVTFLLWKNNINPEVSMSLTTKILHRKFHLSTCRRLLQNISSIS